MMHARVFIILSVVAMDSILCSPAPRDEDRRGPFHDTIIIDSDLAGIAAFYYDKTTTTTEATTTDSTTTDATTTEAATCRYWCRTNTHAIYCCEEGTGTTTEVALKDGTCPKVRPHCPPTRHGGKPPKTCSNDGSCKGNDKCCFDTCLDEHVCKEPV